MPANAAGFKTAIFKKAIKKTFEMDIPLKNKIIINSVLLFKLSVHSVNLIASVL